MVVVIIIYSTNFVFARYSILQGLTTFDLTALRFLVAGIIMLPHFCKLGIKDLGGIGWARAIILTLFAGSPYMIILYLGLEYAPASHGAVLNQAMIPLVVFFSMVRLKIQSFSLSKTISLFLIIFGITLVTASAFSLSIQVLFGDLLFLWTGISWGLFTILTKIWSIKPLEGVSVISVLSLAYLPIYLLFFESNFSSITLTHLISQGIFQGVLLSIVTTYIITYAVKNIGAQTTSLFSPLVPILSTVFAILFLGEIPTLLQWVGILFVLIAMFSFTKDKK